MPTCITAAVVVISTLHPHSIVVEDSRSGIEAAIAANMEVLAYLGGGHARAQWYVDAIRSYGVPIVFKEDDVFDYVNGRLIK